MMPAGRTPQYSSAKVIGICALIAIGASVGAQWLMHLLDFAVWGDIQAHDVAPWVGLLESALSLLSGGCRLLGIPLFLVWIYFAATNTIALGGTMTITPGWAVGSFFIPIASLYMPYKAVAEIASGSDPRRLGITPPAVPLWWAMFLGGNVLRLIGGALASVTDLGTRVAIDTVATLVSTGAAIALVVVVTSINRGQAVLRSSERP